MAARKMEARGPPKGSNAAFCGYSVRVTGGMGPLA